MCYQSSLFISMPRLLGQVDNHFSQSPGIAQGLCGAARLMTDIGENHIRLGGHPPVAAADGTFIMDAHQLGRPQNLVIPMGEPFLVPVDGFGQVWDHQNSLDFRVFLFYLQQYRSSDAVKRTLVSQKEGGYSLLVHQSSAHCSQCGFDFFFSAPQFGVAKKGANRFFHS